MFEADFIETYCDRCSSIIEENEDRFMDEEYNILCFDCYYESEDDTNANR